PERSAPDADPDPDPRLRGRIPVGQHLQPGVPRGDGNDAFGVPAIRAGRRRRGRSVPEIRISIPESAMRRRFEGLARRRRRETPIMIASLTRRRSVWDLDDTIWTGCAFSRSPG